MFSNTRNLKQLLPSCWLTKLKFVILSSTEIVTVDLKTASYFTSKMGTFDNSTRVAIWDIEAMAN